MELRTLDCNDSSKEIRQQEEAKKALVEKSDGDDLSDKVDWPVIEPLSAVESLRENSKGLCWVVATTAFIYLNAMGVRG